MSFNKPCGGGGGSGCGGGPCSAGLPCSLTCQFKEGDASLCGYAEYDSPSTPPRFYRTKSISGSYATCAWVAGENCVGPIFSGGFKTWSGSYGYDAATCAQTDNQTLDIYNVPGPNLTECGSHGSLSSSTTGSVGRDFTAPDITSIPIPTITLTPTSTTTVYPGTCQTSVGGDPLISTKVPETTFVASLTDEDTENDAIKRAMADIGSFTPCDCLSCTSFITDRDLDGVTFSYKQAQVKVHLVGATIGQDYQVTIRFSRRTLGSSGPFIAFSLTEFTFTASHVDDDTDWVDIPNERGFETKAFSCDVEPLGP